MRSLFGDATPSPKSKQLQEEELAFRASGKERRYSWDYDPEMTSAAFAEKSGRLRRLTPRAVTMRKRAYSRRPVDCLSSIRDASIARSTTRKRRCSPRNPSYFAEIYIHEGHGTGQKRLTSVPATTAAPSSRTTDRGYVFRRFDEQGLIADIWTMKPDGRRENS